VKRKKRCFREIAAEILSALSQRPMKLTEISLSANIPTDRCRRVLDFLRARKLVSLTGRTYSITSRGAAWLAEFRRLQALCCGSPEVKIEEALEPQSTGTPR